MNFKINLEESLKSMKEMSLKKEYIIRVLNNYIKIHKLDAEVIIEGEEITIRWP